MKILICYSSKTGNTKKIADAIYGEVSEISDIYPVEDAPSCEVYDLIVMGFWVNRGTADADAQHYMETIKNRQVALFATLGAYPDSMHAKRSMGKASAIVEGGNKLAGTFMCQGKIDPAFLEKYNSSEVYGKRHPMTPEREKRIKEASKHPDENDFTMARDFIKSVLDRICFSTGHP